jgi:hypothetical protein
MSIERAFGILKGRWRILLKRVDVPLQNTVDLVTACICLNNLCIGDEDFFDMDWAKEAQIEAEKEAHSAFANINSIDLLNVAENAIKEMRKLQFPSFNTEKMEELDEENIEEKEEEPPKNPATKVIKKARDEIIKKLLRQATEQH